MIWGIFKISIFQDFGNICGDYPGFPTCVVTPSCPLVQGCRFSIGVGVALSSPDLIVFSLKAVKWVIHPMFFPFLRCPLSLVLFTAQCLQVTCFCILSGFKSCHGQEGQWGWSLLGPTRPRALLPVQREPNLPNIF